MSSKVISRLMVFFVGIPAVICLVWFNQMNHLALHVVVTLLAVAAADELFNMFRRNFKTQNRVLVDICSGLVPLSTLLCAVFGWPVIITVYVFVCAVLLCYSIEVVSAKSFEDSNSHLITSTTIIFYCGFLFSFVSRMTFFEHSQQLLILFLVMVFFCDSFAWLFGNLFGKNNKGFIKASPNKSIAGFIGGFFGSVLAGVLAYKIWPEIFTGDVYKIIILGVLTAFTSIIGDLVESVFKRSSECKDSGTLIPGRGGVLDSIDSIVFSAPVFYLTVTHLYAL